VSFFFSGTLVRLPHAPGFVGAFATALTAEASLKPQDLRMAWTLARGDLGVPDHLFTTSHEQCLTAVPNHKPLYGVYGVQYCRNCPVPAWNESGVEAASGSTLEIAIWSFVLVDLRSRYSLDGGAAISSHFRMIQTEAGTSKVRQ
jgi:hypothetical protein